MSHMIAKESKVGMRLKNVDMRLRCPKPLQINLPITSQQEVIQYNRLNARAERKLLLILCGLTKAAAKTAANRSASLGT